MKYSSNYGATECLDCKAGSYTLKKGAEFCTTECNYTAEINGRLVTFSLAGVLSD